jgi:hypothetical protein
MILRKFDWKKEVIPFYFSFAKHYVDLLIKNKARFVQGFELFA